jgi:hypothetical protein
MAPEPAVANSCPSGEMTALSVPHKLPMFGTTVTGDRLEVARFDAGPDFVGGEFNWACFDFAEAPGDSLEGAIGWKLPTCSMSRALSASTAFARDGGNKKNHVTITIGSLDTNRMTRGMTLPS